MNPINHVFHFMTNHLKHLKKKWYSLLLLFLFPLLLISMLAFMAIQLMSPNERSPIEVGLVNLDGSKESRMVVKMLESNVQIKNAIRFSLLSEQKSKMKIEENKLSAYILFPKDFSSKLYKGESVSLEIIGNPNDRIRAKLVHTFADSAARHINGAQANILAIGDYARELGMTEHARKDLIQKEFKKNIYFTLAKDQLLDEKLLTNSASSSTVLYYAVAGWFSIVLLWLFVCWQFFHTDDPPQLIKRIRLYNITPFYRLIAKLSAVFITVFFPMCFSLIMLPTIFDAVLIPADFFRIIAIYTFITISFLGSLSIMELIITSRKLLLFVQSLWTLMLIFISGAIMPIYFLPEEIQTISGKLFTTSAFHNLQLMIVEEKVFIHPQLLIVTSCIAMLVLFGVSIWKERSY